MRKRSLAFLAVPLILAACDPYTPTPRPDYTIKVVQTPHGDVAIPPTCADWTTNVVDPYDNQSLPQYGCANARDLALEVERPADLTNPRPIGPERGVTAVGAMRRYDANQSRGLIDPDTNPDSAASITTAPTGASGLSGDVTGGGSSSSSGGASSSPAAAP